MLVRSFGHGEQPSASSGFLILLRPSPHTVYPLDFESTLLIFR